MQILEKILKTEGDWASLPLRIAVAAVIFPHGVQKITAFGNMIDILGNAYGLPAFIAILVILIEFFVPILLVIGAITRFSAALIAIIMLGAIPYHWSNGFFMNWFGNQAGEGFQFHIIVIAASAALMIIGGGKWSLDHFWKRKLKFS